MQYSYKRERIYTQGKCGSLTLQPETLTDLVSLERLELVTTPTLHLACCMA